VPGSRAEFEGLFRLRRLYGRRRSCIPASSPCEHTGLLPRRTSRAASKPSSSRPIPQRFQPSLGHLLPLEMGHQHSRGSLPPVAWLGLWCRPEPASLTCSGDRSGAGRRDWHMPFGRLPSSTGTPHALYSLRGGRRRMAAAPRSAQPVLLSRCCRHPAAPAARLHPGSWVQSGIDAQGPRARQLNTALVPGREGSVGNCRIPDTFLHLACSGAQAIRASCGSAFLQLLPPTRRLNSTQTGAAERIIRSQGRRRR